MISPAKPASFGSRRIVARRVTIVLTLLAVYVATYLVLRYFGWMVLYGNDLKFGRWDTGPGLFFYPKEKVEFFRVSAIPAWPFLPLAKLDAMRSTRAGGHIDFRNRRAFQSIRGRLSAGEIRKLTSRLPKDFIPVAGWYDHAQWQDMQSFYIILKYPSDPSIRLRLPVLAAAVAKPEEPFDVEFTTHPTTVENYVFPAGLPAARPEGHDDRRYEFIVDESRGLFYMAYIENY